MPVFLHGFGVRYDLPLSLSLYIVSAAVVVVISFVLVAVFAAEKVGPTAVQYPRRELAFLRGLPRVGWLRALGGVYGGLFLLAIMASGWFGSSRPDRNPAEYLTWIYFWSGLVVLTGLVGPIWDWVNPFRALDSLIRRLRGAPGPSADEADRLAGVGIWPAVLLFFSFACLELTSGYANRPWLVAWLALGYTVLALAGLQWFGARSWLSHVEFFTILFSVLRRLAPVQVDGDRVYLRLWGAGLLDPWERGWDRSRGWRSWAQLHRDR